MLRLALATRCLKLPLLEALRATARAGVSAVQFDVREELKPSDLSDTGLRQFKQRMGEFALEVPTVTFPTRRPLYESERLDERVAALWQAMEFGWKLGARVLTARIGRLPAADSREYSRLIEILADLARAGNHIGVTLAITPTQESPAELKTLLDSIKTGPLGLDLDPGGAIMAGHAPAEFVRTLYDRLLHVQVRDGVRTIDGAGVEAEVGRGQVDWPELLALLQEAVYPGWMTALRTQGDDLPGDTLRAVKFLKQMAFA
jgi:sugar phosphate isomerase/epimerase